MNKFIRRIQIISIVMVLVISGITFLTFYFPMKRELESSYLDNFKVLSESKLQHIQHFADKSIEGAKTISSRTTIKNKGVEYKNGEISIEDLREFLDSNSRYEEGVKVLSNIIGSIRVIEDKVIAEYGKVDYKKIKDLESENPVLYDLEVKNDILQMTVYSSILSEDGVLGYDIVSFDMSKYFDEIIDENYRVEFLHKDSLSNIGNDDLLLKKDDLTLVQDKHNIGFLYKIPESDDFIHIYTLKDQLYGPARKIINISEISFLISLIGFIAVLNFIVLKNASKILYDVESSRDKYKEHAYTDPLTGVYSRTFLNTWVEKVYNKSKKTEKIYSIAMIDSDNFKRINDNYGHVTGDKVLKKIATVLKESVRENDIVIRYGGDEFLIIFENCKSELVHSIFHRIIVKLNET